MRNLRVGLAGVIVALLAVGCGGSDEVAVDEVWGRPSPMSAGNGAFYMQIAGGGEDDTLVEAKSDACGMVELHETSMSDGVMSMQHLPEGIPVPAGATVSLEPGGLHVMCMNVVDPFEEGDMVDVDLVFESGSEMTVTAEIRVEEMSG